MNRQKIFIIEDESIIARDLESILVNYDYSVSGIFANAEDAIKKITANEPDLVLMDITLRGNIDGIEAARRIKKEYSLPVIFLTAFDDDATIKRIKEINHDGYLVKPFEEDKLNEYVEKALRKYKEKKNAVPDDKDAKIKLLESQVEKITAELDQFAYIASHDLQEPLRMVASYVQLLQKRYSGKLEPEADEFINFAVDGVNRMKNIITDLLAFSRIKVNSNSIEENDLNKIAKEAIDTVKSSWPGSSINIKYQNLPKVTCDSEQFTRLFYSLLDNSVKFNENDSEIEINHIKNGKDWTFSISDNGIGIDERYSQRVFEIFQRLHNRTEYPGTGMGLAICKKIIEIHGGKIWFNSTPGKGSTFYFTVPLQHNQIKENGRNITS